MSLTIKIILSSTHVLFPNYDNILSTINHSSKYFPITTWKYMFITASMVRIKKIVFRIRYYERIFLSSMILCILNQVRKICDIKIIKNELLSPTTLTSPNFITFTHQVQYHHNYSVKYPWLLSSPTLKHQIIHLNLQLASPLHCIAFLYHCTILEPWIFHLAYPEYLFLNQTHHLKSY